MIEKSETEKKLNFNLRQDYDGLIRRNSDENKRLKMKPGFIAGVTIFFTLLIVADGELMHKDRMAIFQIGIALAVGMYFYLRLKYKTTILNNNLAVNRWLEEKKLQTEYVNILYKLESDFIKNTNENSVIKMIENLVAR